MRIVQINTSDRLGGAAEIASSLHKGWQSLGFESWLLVGKKRSSDPNVLEFDSKSERPVMSRALVYGARTVRERLSFLPGSNSLQNAMRTAANLDHELIRSAGLEDYHHPASRNVLEMVPGLPEIVHCHNLHGDFFDLRFLVELSQRVPTVVTLHDAWLLSGHCAHSLDCTRWISGCGECPYLDIYPALRRDGTRMNWSRKAGIYERSRLHVATPSQWLMDKVDQSILKSSVVDSRVIPNGVDQSTFRPYDKAKSKQRLGIAPESTVVLFAANGLNSNPWRDFRTLQEAVRHLLNDGEHTSVVFLALGAEKAERWKANDRLRFIPFVEEAETLASIYQAADIYVHSARADTFPTMVLEALSCGVPVIATNVGGIPEQIRSLATPSAIGETNRAPGQATGILIEPTNVKALIDAVTCLAKQPDLRARLGRNAAKDARARFSFDRHLQAYKSWFEDIRASSPAVPTALDETGS